MKKLLKYAFLGMFTKENIPNRKVRHAALMGAYASALYMMQAKYYQSKIEAMADKNVSYMTFRDWLRYQDFYTLAMLVDNIMGDETIEDEEEYISAFALRDPVEEAKLRDELNADPIEF